MRDWSWFPPWASMAVRSWLILLLLGGCLVGSLAFAFAGKRIQRARDDLPLIAVGLAFSLAYWFWSAPDVRFGRGFIFAAAIFGFQPGRGGLVTLSALLFPHATSLNAGNGALGVSQSSASGCLSILLTNPGCARLPNRGAAWGWSVGPAEGRPMLGSRAALHALYRQCGARARALASRFSIPPRSKFGTVQELEAMPEVCPLLLRSNHGSSSVAIPLHSVL